MGSRSNAHEGNEPASPENLPELLSNIVNVRLEEDQHITQLADRKKLVLIAIIAPYTSVRVSPVQEARASIGLPDEFGTEALLRELESTGIENAYLLVNSLGGTMASAYKIARAIRSRFKEITTFVPHVAASGGTLLALVGNEMVMGPMSHLTPLDVQIPYKGSTISATTFTKFFARASKWFEKTAAEEAPYPSRALADKLDPFLMEEWAGLTHTAMDYVSDILQLAGYTQSRQIAEKLVLAFSSHSHVINYSGADGIGLNVKNAADCKETWDIMRYWLSKYIFEEEMTHFIRYAVPTVGSEDQDATEVEAKHESKS